jgi:hypothetical protein
VGIRWAEEAWVAARQLPLTAADFPLSWYAASRMQESDPGPNILYFLQSTPDVLAPQGSLMSPSETETAD